MVRADIFKKFKIYEIQPEHQIGYNYLSVVIKNPDLISGFLN